MRRRSLPLLAVLAGAVAVLVATPNRAFTASESFSFDLTAGPLKEVSGCAFSARDRNLVWVHNDSGDSPRIFAIDLVKKTVRPVTVTDADAVDWEDMAAGPHGSLVIADIGDNDAVRSSVTIYRIPEPKRTDRSVAAVAQSLRFEDGPHDAEAVLVDPTDGAVLVITKSSTSAQVFVAEGDVLRMVSSIGLDESGFFFPNLVTGADAFADGSGVVLRTYQSGYLLRRKKGQPWRTVFAVKPEPFELPSVIQGESICVRTKDRVAFTTSESRGAKKIPIALTPVPR